MTKLQNYVKDADQQLILAQHLLTKTYPLSGDLKVLLSVLQTIKRAQDNIFLAVLDNEFLRPKISPSSSFIVKFDRFSQLVLSKGLLEEKDLSVFKTVNEDWNYHNESSMEFVRGENVLMADNDFKIKKLNAERLKNNLSQTQLILRKLFNTK